MRLLITCLLLAISAPAWAQSTHVHEHSVPQIEHNKSVSSLLQSIDTVPSRETFEAAHPNPSQALQAIAMDDTQGTYLRRRAITLLSHWPTEQNLNFLRSLQDLKVKELRTMAVYTIGQVYGETHSEIATQAIEVALKDSELEVREWAVRALRWTAGERASTLLAELRNDKELGRLAERAQRNHLR